VERDLGTLEYHQQLGLLFVQPFEQMVERDEAGLEREDAIEPRLQDRLASLALASRACPKLHIAGFPGHGRILARTCSLDMFEWISSFRKAGVVKRIVPNIGTAEVAAARRFYVRMRSRTCNPIEHR
jgi:hypothetical protein